MRYRDALLSGSSSIFAVRFLNRDFTDNGIRSLWGQVKVGV